MKKIFNWLFGSFFRTIGKVIAFLVLGSIFAYIINSNGLLDNFDLFSFLGIRVNASTHTYNLNEMYGNNIFYSSDYCYSANNCNYEIANRTNFSYTKTVNDSSTKLVYFNFSDINMIQDEYFILPLYLYNNRNFKFIDNTSRDTSIISENYIYTRIDVWTTNKGFGTCEYLTNNNDLYYYKCPTSQDSLHALRISVEYEQTPNTNILQPSPQITYGIGELLTGYGGNSSVENAINEMSEQQHQDSQNTQNAINNVNDSLNDDNIDESTSEASSFFNDFTTDTHGLTSIITAPLNSIQSLTSKNCSSLQIPIPFLNNKKLVLPCMRTIYEEFFGDFMDIYDVICIGIVSYWIMVRIFNLVKDFKNPDHDEIEVMDL